MSQLRAGFNQKYVPVLRKAFFRCSHLEAREELVESVLLLTTRTLGMQNWEKEFFFLPMKNGERRALFSLERRASGNRFPPNARNFIGRGVHPCTFFGARVLRPVSAALNVYATAITL